MAAGWDVLLHGERSASGRMDLGDGHRVRGRVRVEGEGGVRVVCEVVGEGPLSAEDVLEAAFQERGYAGKADGALRAVA
jgi:hypothetical protein